MACEFESGEEVKQTWRNMIVDEDMKVQRTEEGKVR